MTGLLEQIGKEAAQAFEAAGYDGSYGRVTVSNRPDLCEFQCSGAMAAKKAYGKVPRDIAADVLPHFEKSSAVVNVKVEGPGFINFDLSDEFLTGYLSGMAADERLGFETVKEPKTMIIDYGGPNVAKPLHIGHLRSAIIGESIKRIAKFAGDKVIGDVHLGDWGLQMGLIITELKARKPDLIYFREDAPEDLDSYPAEAPFTISELEEIYPYASARSKEDESYKTLAMEATHDLQTGKPGYRALWNKIMEISVSDLKKNYERLNVSFELWKGESDVQPYIAPMVERMKAEGTAHYDQGALVIDVA